MHYAIKRKRRNDFGVKGMKKGVRKTINTVSNSTVGRAVKTIGKNYKKAFNNNLGIANHMMKQKNIGHIASANRAAGTALHIRNFERQHGLGDSAAFKDSLIVMEYRKRQLRDAKVAYLKAKKRCLARRDSNLRHDSQAKLIIAKRRYQDALRRYQDSVLDTLKQKFKSVLEKIKKTVKEYIKAFPFLSSLTAGLMSMSSIGDAYGIVAGAPKILSTLEYQSKLIDRQDFSAYGKAGLKTRNVILALYVIAKQIIKSIIKLKIAKGISETLKEK